MIVRPEHPADYDAVYRLNASVFPTPAEAALVNALRKQASPYVSLVAEREQLIIGHILFSPVTTATATAHKLMGLAPMAVAAEMQGSGVGTALIKAGLRACRDLDVAAVVVLGHAEYYPRFGFQAASRFNIRCQYDVPDDAFMALELQPGVLQDIDGEVHYHPAFATV